MAQHNETGKIGELIAVAHLQKLNMIIIEVNWRYKNFEIDIIAAKKNYLHFVEVKTRRCETYGHPEEKVTTKKINYLMKAADEYLEKNNLFKRIQFDIISVLIKNNEPEIFYIEDVYQF